MNRRFFAQQVGERLLTLGVFGAGVVTATVKSARANDLAPEPSVAAGTQPPRTNTPAKIVLVHVRAADVAVALGGSVLDESDAITKPARTTPAGWNRQSVSSLVPEGITGILAYGRDNSLLVQYDDPQALTALQNVIRLIDIAPRQIEVRVVVEARVRTANNGRAAVTMATGRRSRSARVELVTRVLSGQGARIETTAQTGEQTNTAPPASSGRGRASRGLPAPRLTSVECYVEPGVTDSSDAKNANLLLTLTGTVALAWSPELRSGAPAAARAPLRARHFFDSATRLRSQSAVVVSRATLPLGDTEAVADIVVTVSPRLLDDANDQANSQARSR